MSKSVNTFGHFDPSVGLGSVSIKELEEVQKTLLPAGSPSNIEREMPDASAELFPTYQLQSLWMNSLAPKRVSNLRNQPATMADRILLLVCELEKWLEPLTKKATPLLLQKDPENQERLTKMLQELLPLLQEDRERRECLTKMLQKLLPLLQEDRENDERLAERQQAFLGP